MASGASRRLQTLLRLADLRERDAAKALAAQSERLQQAEQQAQALARYEQEYQQDYSERGARSFSRRDLLNYQGFFRQLENARLTQERTVQLRDHEREQARLRWLQLNARRRLLAQLQERRLRQEEQEQERRLQRELDDRAARARRERS